MSDRRLHSESLWQRWFSTSQFVVYLLLVATAVAFVFVYQRGQDLNWDLRNYHFYTGYALLTGRYAQDIAAAGFQSFLHPATNLFAYVSLRYLPFPFSAWTVLLVQLVSLPAIALIARELGKGLGYRQVTLSQLLAVMLCLLSPLWWSELGTTFFSSWTAPAILWGIYLLVRCFSVAHVPHRSLFLAGALLGFASGLKLTNAPFAVAAFCMLLLTYDGKMRPFMRRVMVFVAGGFFGFMLTAWWYGYLWIEWKSPLFPLYNGIFESPYYYPGNFRDQNWKFFSFGEFWSYLYQSAIGTVKTSEVTFADARLLSISALIPVALLAPLIRKPAVKQSKSGAAVLLFVGVSFILWAVMFAYQRYLIPIELLLGLVAWVLVARIFRPESLRVLALLILVGVSTATLKVPDWGHGPADVGAGKPFSVVLPERLVSAPARYLAVGSTISYVLPYLHADSIFYGLNLSRASNALIAQRLREPSQIPIRILAEDSSLPLIWSHLEEFGFSSDTHSLDCSYMKTAIGRYSACEVIPGTHTLANKGVIINAAFVDADFAQTKGVLWMLGFSSQESWGRWTDSDTAEIGFQACLPQGPLRVSVTASAFGANVGQSVRFTLGSQDGFAAFDLSQGNKSMYFVNKHVCADRLTIQIPAAGKPAKGESVRESRRLGLGFTRVEITKE